MQPHRVAVAIAIEHNPGPVIFIKGITRRINCNPRSKTYVLCNQTSEMEKRVAQIHNRAELARQ
jgi:hypothetical protein